MRTYRIQVRLIQTSVLLTILVLISGFLGAWGNEPRNTEPVLQQDSPGKVVIEGKNKRDPKIVALGDSYTYGYPKDEDTAWPKYLEKYLNVPVVNKGKVSQTSLDLLNRFEEDVVGEKPGRVIIFVGAGDVLRGGSLDDFQISIKAMVDKAEANQIEVILALPLPFPSVQKEIQEFREWELSYAQEKGLLVLDFKDVLMDQDNKYKEGLSDDGKYPTPEGYNKMGEYAARVLQ